MSDANPNPTGREPMTDLDRLRECADLMRQGKAVFCPEVLEAAHERLAALEQPGVGEEALDAARYRRLRVLGCAPMNTPELERRLVLRFTNLDKIVDEDMRITPSRGEARGVSVAALAAAPIAQGGERYRHVKRGTEYEVIGTAELQIATGDLVDGSALVVYRGDDGKVWARQEDEFHDGRFVALQPPGAA